MRKAIIRNVITGQEWECVSSTDNSMSSYGQAVWENKAGEALCNDTENRFLQDPQFEVVKVWEE